MNTPNSIPTQSVPGEPTGPYQSSGASPGGPPGRIKVALVAGPGLHLTSEVQFLLRKRLRVIALVMGGLPGLGALGTLLALLLGRTDEFAWFLWQFFIAAPPAVVAAILWSRRSLSLRRLRGMELIAFGVPVTLMLYVEYEWIRNVGVMLNPGEYANARALLWVLLIIGYGIFIPNTWRRCAAVVGVLALLPLVVSAIGGLMNEVVSAHSLRWYLAGMGTRMALATAIAVFGSNKISRLQQEAFEARRLGQYQLKQRLGAGGMGEVYLAEHVLLRRPCAVKLIRPEKAGDPTNLRRFEREVQATATLTHPNTVLIFDYGHAEDGTFYYVMEYLPGLSLEQLVSRHGSLRPERAIHILLQVCGALREAHDIGLIHRDIKPSNILICERGGLHDVAKLLDFGLVLAQAVSEDGEKLTQEGVIAGTPAYMSPEQAGGQECLDPRSDIYSLGAVAYSLLTGQPPFADRSAVKMLAAHMYEPPAPLSNHRPDVPVDLQSVVLRCLAKDPAERFADAESLEIALAGCHDAGHWSENQAANWWRSQAGPSGKVGEELGHSSSPRRTSR